MNNDSPAVMGQYLRHEQFSVNIHTLINSLYRTNYAFLPTAVIIGKKEYPDVSLYQLEIDWDIMRSKTDAVIIREGQNEWIDTQFLRNWSQAKARNMYRGVYRFYDGRKSPFYQAQQIADHIENDLPEMEVIVDWERSYGGSWEGLSNVVTMMKEIEKRLPTVKVMLYTGYYWFTSNSNPISNALQYNYLKDKRLHLAWYTMDFDIIKVPNPFPRIHLLQYGTPKKGFEYGAKSIEIDMNIFNDTDEMFYETYGGAIPPEEIGMFYGRNKTALTNIRTGPAGTFADIGDLLLNDLIEADRKQKDLNGVDWWHLTKITRNGLNISLPATDCWCWGTNIESLPPPQPSGIPAQVDITLTNGSVVTIKDSNGNVLWTGTAASASNN